MQREDAMRLENKVALVTGAGSGMGQASAALFAKEGAAIAVVDLDQETGKETMNRINQAGGESIFIKADVGNPDDAAAMVSKTVDKFGKLDILMNNAGIAQSMTPVEEIEEAVWDNIFNVNVKAIYLACRHAVPIMKKQGGGAIINTASVIGVRPRPKLCAYLASKGAAITLTKGLAIELAPFNIRVNCLNPVATDTPMFPYFIHESGARDASFEEAKKKFIETVPMGRMATSEDIAKAALFLASEDSAFITGVGIEVDGGRAI